MITWTPPPRPGKDTGRSRGADDQVNGTNELMTQIHDCEVPELVQII
jgi:hypothetical protein